MAEKKKSEAQVAAAEEKAAAEHQGEGREEARDRVDKPAVNQEKGEPPGRDTPSALALEKVGPDGDGEEYAAEKKKHRWG